MPLNNQHSFEENWDFSESNFAKIGDIIKQNADVFLEFRKANYEQDTKQATDMVIDIQGTTVAVRVRRPNCKFRDLTLRAKTGYNGKTEIDKIREGFGDWYLYAWEDSPGVINEWMLIDLDKLRKSELLKLERFQSNGDGTGFYWYKQSELNQCGCLLRSDKK